MYVGIYSHARILISTHTHTAIWYLHTHTEQLSTVSTHTQNNSFWCVCRYLNTHTHSNSLWYVCKYLHTHTYFDFYTHTHSDLIVLHTHTHSNYHRGKLDGSSSSPPRCLCEMRHNFRVTWRLRLELGNEPKTWHKFYRNTICIFEKSISHTGNMKTPKWRESQNPQKREIAEKLLR